MSWFDILVHSKQIVWIPSGLGLGQFVVIFSVSSADALVSFFFGQKINIRAARGELTHRLPGIACPINIKFIICRVIP